MEQRLRVFVTVAKAKNFSRAAEQLHLTQPAVSQHIRSLEETFGTLLLERTNKSVRLTPAGEILLQEGEKILHQYERMERLIHDLTQGTGGPLSIGASYTFGEYVLPRIISAFGNQYPGVNPSVTIANTTEIAEGVRRRRLDIGIVEGEVHHQELTIRHVADDELMVVLPAEHPLSGQQITPLTNLANENWILREPGSGTRAVADSLFQNNHFTPLKVMEFGSIQTIKESVEAGMGITLLSPWAIRKEQFWGTLFPIRIKDCPLHRRFTALTHATSFHTQAMNHFLRFLIREVKLRTPPS
nr:LysR family transcriptional regulator [Melghirimyces algeriensis]